VNNFKIWPFVSLAVLAVACATTPPAPPLYNTRTTPASQQPGAMSLSEARKVVTDGLTPTGANVGYAVYTAIELGPDRVAYHLEFPNAPKFPGRLHLRLWKSCWDFGALGPESGAEIDGDEARETHCGLHCSNWLV
jgi:hypothetical protein